MLIIVILLLISTDLFAADIKLNEVRLLFQKSATDEASCKKIILQNGEQKKSYLDSYSNG